MSTTTTTTITRPSKAALLSSLGAGFEYYDFIIYGMMAEHLSVLFFTNDLVWINLIKAFAIFAVGYVARPFGGIFFGMLGDTYGRKKVFLSVMMLMALATFGIGLLPTYAQVGSMAPCLLIFLRLLQGLSFGAELPGAMIVVYEYASEKRQGLYAGVVLASTSIGAMLASLVLYCLSQAFLKEQILNWGWRIPFLFGGVLVLVNYLIRKNLDETPAFVNWQKARQAEGPVKEPFLAIVRGHKRQIIQGVGLSLFVSSLVITALYFPTYLTIYFGYSSADVYLAMLCSLIWSAMILPVCGCLADRIGKGALFILTIGLFVLGATSLFSLLQLKSFAALQFFLIVYQTVIALASGCYFPLLVALFPTKVRYTGTAACYNITYAFVAVLPIVLTALIRYSDTPMSIVWVLIVCALITAVSIPYQKFFSYFTGKD